MFESADHCGWLTGAILCYIHNQIRKVHRCCHSFPETTWYLFCCDKSWPGSLNLEFHHFKSHLMICATMEGPYQSPAFFPELFPNSTSWCIPNGAVGRSANHDTTRLCVASMGLSSREPKLSVRLIFLVPSLKLGLKSAGWFSRSISSLNTWWLTDQVQPQRDGEMKQ